MTAAATITVVTSRCTPSSAWRPSDAEVIEVPSAEFEPAAWATNENGPVGLAAELAEMIRVAARFQHPLRWNVDIKLDWSDETVAAIFACGGEIERAYWTGGYYALARLRTGRLDVSSVGPKFYGPMTPVEDAQHVEDVKKQLARIGVTP